VTQSSHAQIVVEPGRVRVISVVDEARLEPQVVGEYIDWRAATETELSIGFARGDEACLQEVFRRLAPLIYTIAYRTLDSSSDGEEITQEVFVSAWRARDNYQAEKGSLSGWLIGITRHRIADRQRARGRDLRLVQAVTNTTDQVQPETLSTLVDRIVLTEEIGRLPIHAAPSFSSPSGKDAATRRSLSNSTSHWER
jgi:RNA polymerase sigma factor (sigma-70 family)